MSEAYKNAGVDVEAGYEAVKLMKSHVARTMTPGVISDIGGFGGLFGINKDEYDEPLLVSGTDGVGTKLRIAFIMDKHNTVGQDCVAMCVNDIACSGAKPLFFLDYLAVGKNVPSKIAEIVSGVADGCVLSGAALIGGETAEMPGFYDINEYDLAGFAVGIADKSKLIDGKKISAGNTLIGIASSGVHSNGFSLVRKIFDIDNNPEVLKREYAELGQTLGDTLLTPTKIYVKAILEIIKTGAVFGISHITGGGFIENIPRMLPEGTYAEIKLGSFPVLPIFSLMGKEGGLSTRDLYNTFNMGIGLVMAVDSEKADEVIAAAARMGEKAYVIGSVKEGKLPEGTGVELC